MGWHRHMRFVALDFLRGLFDTFYFCYIVWSTICGVTMGANFITQPFHMLFPCLRVGRSERGDIPRLPCNEIRTTRFTGDHPYHLSPSTSKMRWNG